MNYAIYFNKKHKRVGHLWQGRFKSWYVTDEAYLYTLMRYIEQNPLKAGIVEDIAHYPYSSYRYFLYHNHLPECLKDSWIAQHYKTDKEAIEAFLTQPVDMAQLQELKKASSLIEAPNIDTKPDIDQLKRMLNQTKEIRERNKQIVQAYRQGYSQHMIAKVLGLNQATVQRIIKRTKT